MNKVRVNSYLDKARAAIIHTGMARNNRLEGNYRSQISSFGAAIVMGSLKSAIAFFSQKNGASVDRPKIIVAMYLLVTGEEFDANTVLRDEPAKGEKESEIEKKAWKVFDYVCKNDNYETKEKFCDASIALKLVCNTFSKPEARNNQNENNNAQSGESE